MTIRFCRGRPVARAAPGGGGDCGYAKNLFHGDSGFLPGMGKRLDGGLSVRDGSRRVRDECDVAEAVVPK